MIILSILLFLIYIVYFRSDGGSLASAMKILKGLNSNTFNYLEENMHDLRADRSIAPFEIAGGKSVSTQQFFS